MNGITALDPVLPQRGDLSRCDRQDRPEPQRHAAVIAMAVDQALLQFIEAAASGSGEPTRASWLPSGENATRPIAAVLRSLAFVSPFIGNENARPAS